jgi:predicted P-loop ATPase
MFLIGAIARVMRPPVKMDTVLIFEGLQGLGKSTALKILGGEWFTDTPLVLGDKDCFQQMQGVWIIELAELDSFNKADHTRAKQFFGSQVDRFRPSYGRLTQTFARQCVFAGSTNQTEYFRDATGNRRYWPVTCTRIEAEALESDRDMLWAEAYQCYLRGEQWWPNEEHKNLFSEQQENRFEADVWESVISSWLSSMTRDRVLMHEIMQEALRLEASQMKPPEQKRVGQIMAHLGWQRVRARVPGGRETGYERPVEMKIAA